MLEHTKRQVVMIKTNVFITAVCILFLIELRWPSYKSLYDTWDSVSSHFQTTRISSMQVSKLTVYYARSYNLIPTQTTY